MLTHGNLINRNLWYYKTLSIVDEDVLSSQSNIMFCDYQTQTVSFILRRMPIVLFRTKHYENINKYVEYLDAYNITRLVVVPSLFTLLISAAQQGNLKSLTHVICSGEILMNKMAHEFVNLFPATRLYNFYGRYQFAE